MNELDRQAVIQSYIYHIKELYVRDDATEHSYRPYIQQLIHDLLPDYIAINERRRESVGAPDLVIFKRQENSNQPQLFPDIPLGFVEAKDIKPRILDRPENQEQIQRYMELGNVIHTDGLSFRFYFDKVLIKEVAIAHVNDSGHIVDHLDNGDDLYFYLRQTVEQAGQTIRTAKSLALLMADRARPIRRTILSALEQDIDTGENTDIVAQYTAFRQTLIHDLTPANFADIYAETIAYGLFAARYNDDSPEDFSLAEAATKIPSINPFLQKFFREIVAYEADVRINWVLNNFVDLFSHTDVHKIMSAYGATTGMSHDPVTHFYETFLGEYDHKRRKARGVYYTPLPVVQYIVRSVDKVLRDEFGLVDGLANDSTITHTFNVDPYKIGKAKDAKTYYTKDREIPRVQILDPATGTSTFLNEILNYIYKIKGERLGSMWSDYVEKSLLQRMHGFEILMAAYSMAHMRLGLTLDATGYKPSAHAPRLGIYLTNTLEAPAYDEPPLLGLLGMGRVLTEEAIDADRIKRDLPIMIVMGNPPYSGESSNKTKFANSLINKYKYEPGGKVKLNERNPKWLNDDYVKFISYAEDLVEKNGSGVVAMITNNGYLDNPTFRGMRWHLAKTFDKIYVLDLHGNAKKKEIHPDGSKDENVFDIMQGVGIMIAIKTGKKRSDEMSKVYHNEIYGLRKHKYSVLESSRNADDELRFNQINLDPKMMYFVPKNNEGKALYDEGVALNELFIVNSVGIVTSSDAILIAGTPEQVLLNVREAKQSNANNKIVSRLHKHDIDPNLIKPISYRPFDVRFVYYDTNIVERARKNVMKHFYMQNYGLVFKRGSIEQKAAPVFIVNNISESRSWSRPGMQGVESNAPLYVYHDDGTRTSNFNPTELSVLTRNIDSEPSPEDVLDYIYAVLHSPSYREAYREFLKVDFPRVPAPVNDAEFERLVAFGHELRELHLMKSPALDQYDTTYPETGSDFVESIKYIKGKVWLNGTQYFGNVPEAAWNFYIGGYQPAQKWLKDRKGRPLDYKETTHYQKIIKILIETDRIIKKIG